MAVLATTETGTGRFTELGDSAGFGTTTGLDAGELFSRTTTLGFSLFEVMVPSGLILKPTTSGFR